MQFAEKRNSYLKYVSIKHLTNPSHRNWTVTGAITFYESPVKLEYVSISNNRSEDALNIYHHIGIYCYSSEILKNFVELAQSKNEIENRLEQLRALDNNIKINVALANKAPIGVDTEEDYLALKKIMEYKS